MADPTLAPPRRGLQSGFGFHRLRTVWSAAGSLERAEPAQARAALASSVTSGFGRSTLHSARLAAQWDDRKSTRLNSSHGSSSYAVFCLKKKRRDDAPGVGATGR